MLYFLLYLHSWVRWLVVGSLVLSLYTAYKGLLRKAAFHPIANTIRHWTATIAHIQLVLGITIYFQSPVVQYAVINDGNAVISQGVFFRYLHSSLMITAIVVITIGSAMAKRANTDRAKYRTMLGWYTVGLMLILLAIPWPFYEALSRPLIRRF